MRRAANIHGMDIKVSIVEDDSQIRGELSKLINGAENVRCISAYSNAEAALEEIPRLKPDVVLMDINLPNMNGVECIRRLRANSPEVKCLMLTVYEESEKIFNSLLAGASGYLLKRTRTAELLEAIREVRDGGSPMSSSIARKVVAYFNEMGAAKSSTAALTPRELQVLELLAKGMAYKNIADELSLSIETIRMNVKHIYTKLHVHSRGEAAAKYLQQSPLQHAANQKAKT